MRQGQEGMRIGVLAKRTGISVRTLHHYDRIGLLTPAGRTESAHRRYSAQDIARLQQIRSLRHLGFSLQEIRDCLSDPAFSPQHVIALHLSSLREQEAQVRELRQRLERMAHWMAQAQAISGEEFLTTLAVMTKMEKYLTPEVHAEVRAREERLGRERVDAGGVEWRRLLADLQMAMEAGADPAGPRVQVMGQRMVALIKEFTDGYPAITAFAHAVHGDPDMGQHGAIVLAEVAHGYRQADLREPAGISPALSDYLHRVMVASGAEPLW